jgi:hypothetical protein
MKPGERMKQKPTGISWFKITAKMQGDLPNI